MGTYRATRNYSSNHNGRFFAFSEGDQTEVDDDVAAWVNRDSPGTLEPATGDDLPNVSDKKAVWVAYAESKRVVGADDFTKDQLIEGAPDYVGFPMADTDSTADGTVEDLVDSTHHAVKEK